MTDMESISEEAYNDANTEEFLVTATIHISYRYCNTASPSNREIVSYIIESIDGIDVEDVEDIEVTSEMLSISSASNILSRLRHSGYIEGNIKMNGNGATYMWTIKEC